MKKPYSMEKEKSALDLVEEGFHLLRSATPGTYAAYLLGTVPFLLALLFFWSDMSRSPFAAQRLVSGALGLALLFCWMKLCQTVFAARLLAQVSGEGSPRWTASRLWQAAVVQTILQPLGLLLIPVSLALLFPFAWVYSFFQNATVLGSDEPRVLSLMAKSWRGARLWPTQNHALLLMLKGLGLIILIDLFLGWVGAMYLLQSFFGIQTAFTQSQWAFLNTTFFAVILSLAYLCLDPLIKTIYVLRCFYGESLHSGRDLKAELKSLQRNPTALLAAMLFLTCLPALSAAADPPPSRPTSSAERSAVTPAELDQSIEKVLRKREYTWRLPRNTEALEKSSKENAFFKKLAEWSRALRDGMDRFVKWLTRGKKPNLNMPGSGEGWFTVLRGTMVLLLLAVVCSIGWLLVKIWRRYERDSIPTLSAEPLGP
ncbi:MAG TPA: hypothetical protein VMZ27_03970, partial [Candidatus Saccharimonadales bacterium]|nr:hypothetical protein [Candidatus Saccharimonadales bacterium]